MKMKKMIVTTAVGTMLMGDFASIPLNSPMTKQVEAAVTVPYVAPQDVTVDWITGDYINSVGTVYKDASKSSRFTTQNVEKGTLVIDLKNNNFPHMENYRHPSTYEYLPFFLYAQPYLIDGRNQYAKKVTSKQNTDFLNRDSAKDFTIRQVYYIDQPKSDKNYYLGGAGISDPTAFHVNAQFFPNVDLTGMTKADRSEYIVKANNGKKIPESTVSHIGRVLIKGSDLVLYNPEGKVHRKLKQYEGLRVFEVQNDRYQVGGGYYVKKTKDTLFYIGHVYNKDQYLYVYKPNGEVFKKFKPMENVQVYSTENGRYDVGAGYYVLPDFHVNFDR